ncbi:MAG: hypothetical protein K2G55_07050, partial [Lachnospiraceae bacterium]|nr:hypothetical protein [Lachnospiraceae bacterium]
LYMHYTMHGAGEGREPFNKKTLDLNNILPYQGTGTTTPEQPADTTQPTDSQQPSENANVLKAIVGETYQFPSVHSAKYNYAPCTVTVSREPSYDELYLPEILESYSLPGYEWRVIDLSFTTDGVSTNAATGADMAAILEPYHDFAYSLYVDYYDYYADNYTSVQQDIGDWITYWSNFTITQNGKDYTECKIFMQNHGGMNEYYYRSWYALVPENYNGELTIGYTGVKRDAGEYVEEKASPIVLFRF